MAGVVLSLALASIAQFVQANIPYPDADGRQFERIETAPGTTPVGATGQSTTTTTTCGSVACVATGLSTATVPTATRLIYNGQTLLHEATPDASVSTPNSTGLSITASYRHSALLDRHIAIAQSGALTIRSYQLDALQTPVAMTDSNGNTVTRTTFDAWGNIEEQVANGITQAPWQLPNYAPNTTGQAALLSNDHQRIGFTGYQKDPATGLYYAGARWYDPLVGNFNAMDPAQGRAESPITFNKYVYANANPLAFIDIDGRENTSAQAMRFFELSHTSNPAREAELRQQIGPEAIRANARFAATLGFAQDTATGLVDLAKDLGKIALESQNPGLNLGGASAMAERAQALASAVRHPIDTFITPIQDNNRRAAELEAQGQIFAAELARQKAVIGSAEVLSIIAGGSGAVRKLTTTRGLAIAGKPAVVTEGASGGVNFKFAPQGITDAPNTFAEGKRMIARLQQANPGLSVEKVNEIARGLLKSGAERPTMRGIEPGEKLFKLTPKGQKPGEKSSFFMFAETAERAQKGDFNIADGFGLPKGSEASIYDAYSVTPKPGQYPAVFKSTVANTIEGDVRRNGGEDQALIVNRALFTEPEFEFEIPERER